MRSRSNSGVKLDNYARMVHQTILRHQVRACCCRFVVVCCLLRAPTLVLSVHAGAGAEARCATHQVSLKHTHKGTRTDTHTHTPHALFAFYINIPYYLLYIYLAFILFTLKLVCIFYLLCL